MGGKGSGATKESWTKRKYEQAAAGQQTPETREYFALLRRQMSDRLFEVHRVYPSGKKAMLGTVANLKADTLGKMFGAGEYELYEVDRGTGEATNKPPVKRILHPGKYPLKEEYARDPMDAELLLNPPATPPHVAAAAAAAGDLSAMSPAQIYERATAEALERFRREQEMKDLKDQLLRLEQRLANPPAPAQDQQLSGMAQLREMMGLVKELMPPPVPNPLTMPQAPLDTVRQAVEAIKLFQGELSGLGIGPAAPKENPALVHLVTALKDIAQAAIPAMAAARPLPVQRPPMVHAPAPVGAPAPGPRPAAGAAPGAGAAPATSPAAGHGPAPVSPAQQADLAEQERMDMLHELATKLRQDQADQLAVPPRSHVQDTVRWIRQRSTDAGSTATWRNLPNVVSNFSEGAIVAYIAQAAPDLTDSDAKKNWLLSVVDLLKKAP